MPSPNPLASFKFGAAVGVSRYMHAPRAVEAAEVAGGLVRVTDSSRDRARLIMEVHRPIWTFRQKERQIKLSMSEAARMVDNASANAFNLSPTVTVASLGIGPFAAIQSGGQNVLDGFAAGMMLSILRDTESGSDLNFGFGLMLDNKVQVLGDGLVANRPLPAGETAIRFRKESRWSFVFLVSVGGK